MMGFVTEKTDTREKYEGLRSLWCEVFGDEPEFVDHVYRTFGSDITGYVIRNDEGRAVSALTCYRCGEMAGPDTVPVPVYVSYAICTDSEYRGKGLAGRLTEDARDEVTAAGGVSLLSPAEESLQGFYRELGYRESCFAVYAEAASDGADPDEEFDAPDPDEARLWGLGAEGMPGFLDGSDEAGSFRTAFSIEAVDPEVYSRYREKFLAEEPHVALSREMLEFIRSESVNGDGLCVINGGDAVCMIAGSDSDPGPDREAGASDGRSAVWELIVNPELRAYSEEIAGEIALQLAEYTGADRLEYRTPVYGGCVPDQGCVCQSMSAGAGDDLKFYFGFPVE